MGFLREKHFFPEYDDMVRIKREKLGYERGISIFRFSGISKGQIMQ